MTDDIVTRLREMATERARYSTHYEGCDQWHIECAALHACDEIKRLRTNLEEAYDACRYALADSPRWHENAATVIAEWEARRGQ